MKLLAKLKLGNSDITGVCVSGCFVSGVNEEEYHLSGAGVIEANNLGCTCSDVLILVDKLCACSILHLYPNANGCFAIVGKLEGEHLAICGLIFNPDIDVCPRVLYHISIGYVDAVRILSSRLESISVLGLELNVEIGVGNICCRRITRILTAGEVDTGDGYVTCVRIGSLCPTGIDEEVKRIGSEGIFKARCSRLTCRNGKLSLCRPTCCVLKLNGDVYCLGAVVLNGKTKGGLTCCLILNPGINVLVGVVRNVGIDNLKRVYVLLGSCAESVAIVSVEGKVLAFNRLGLGLGLRIRIRLLGSVLACERDVGNSDITCVRGAVIPLAAVCKELNVSRLLSCVVVYYESSGLACCDLEYRAAPLKVGECALAVLCSGNVTAGSVCGNLGLALDVDTELSGSITVVG